MTGNCMAGISIVTTLDAEEAVKTVSKVAKRLQFSVHRVEDWELVVQKGSLGLSIFLGAFIAYCYFHVYIEEDRRNTIAITIERNSPWWTGLIGVSRTKSWCKTHADEIEDAIENKGGEVVKREEVR